MNKTINTIVAIILFGLFSQSSVAEIAVIVDLSVSVDSVATEQLQRLYLNKPARLKANVKLTPIDQKKGSSLRKEFTQKVLKKTERQLTSYWSRLMFSGKGNPPQQYDNDATVLEQVTANPGTVGYIDSASVNESVKVILRIP